MEDTVQSMGTLLTENERVSYTYCMFLMNLQMSGEKQH